MLRKTLLFCFTLSLAMSVQAQTVNEILTKYFENTGGEQNWKSIKSTKMVATMAMQGMEFPGTIYSAPPNKQRVIVNVQGQEIVQAYDGEVAWMINPLMGTGEAQKVPTEMAEEMAKQEFESPFIGYKEKGHEVVLEGKETVDGTETFKVKITKKNGTEEYYFFDTEYYVPIMVQTAVTSGPMKGQMTSTYMSDYQEVDGLMMPFFIETKVGGQTAQKITIKEIQLNVDLKDELFAFPAKK